MDNPRIYRIIFASVYPMYIEKAEKKGRTKAEVDQIIYWLTGYNPKEFQAQLQNKVNLQDFYSQAPKPNLNRALIKGVVCGVRLEELKDPMVREIRYLDKLIDELAAGKSMEKILRKQ